MKKAAITSGDVNFAAALMTMGCPPADLPVRLIAHENGHDYASFGIVETAIDGASAYVYSRAWTYENEMSALRAQNHAFVRVSDFSASKPRATGPSRDAWISHMADFLDLKVDAAHALMRDVRGLCMREPESPVSYIAAFIENRFWLLACARHAVDNGEHSIYMSHGSGMSLIDQRLPQRVKDYLLKNV